MSAEPEAYVLMPSAQERLDIYVPVEMGVDISHLSEAQKELVSLLIDAADIMDELFWMQAYPGDRQEFLARIPDPQVRQFAEINYGPWDRLNNMQPFLQGYGPKPAGANYYPADMTREEFDAAELAGKDDLYTLVRRNDAGELYTVAYSEKYREQLEKAAAILRAAAAVADDEKFAEYLIMRADAFLTDDYQPSDYAWMDVTDSVIDVIIGPIETYEDRLFGYKAGFEAYVLVKDLEWSERLAVYAEHLPALQRGLPVADEYKAEEPGAEAQLNAYDIVYYGRSFQRRQ